jgi:hypothetical protein
MMPNLPFSGFPHLPRLLSKLCRRSVQIHEIFLPIDLNNDFRTVIGTYFGADVISFVNCKGKLTKQ